MADDKSPKPLDPQAFKQTAKEAIENAENSIKKFEDELLVHLQEKEQGKAVEDIIRQKTEYIEQLKEGVVKLKDAVRQVKKPREQLLNFKAKELLKCSMETVNLLVNFIN